MPAAGERWFVAEIVAVNDDSYPVIDGTSTHEVIAGDGQPTDVSTPTESTPTLIAVSTAADTAIVLRVTTEDGALVQSLDLRSGLRTESGPAGLYDQAPVGTTLDGEYTTSATANGHADMTLGCPNDSVEHYNVGLSRRGQCPAGT